MCGRFALNEAPRTLAGAFGLDAPLLEPRYNIAPTQLALVLLNSPERRGPDFQVLSWGLVPFWSRDKSMAARLINARVEGVAAKPSFRASFRHRRCLVPASGFYEWDKKGGGKTPYYFTARGDGRLLAFAGLWDEWEGGGEYVRSFAIITCPAGEDMAAVHDRMPLVVDERDWERWLDASVQNPGELADIVSPAECAPLRKRRVGSYVNNPRNEGPQCLDLA